MIALRPSGSTRVILVRHGEAAIEPGRICGRLDPPLSAAGRARIRQVARWLGEEEVAAVCASPARRAVQTARLLAAGRALRIEQVPGLREVDFGAFEGLSWEEARARDPETCAAWLARPHEVTFPGGDGFAGVSARALAAMAALRARHPAETLLVVAHAGVNRAILADALGMTAANAFRIDQATGAVNLLDWLEGGAVVRLVNGGPGPAGPDPAGPPARTQRTRGSSGPRPARGPDPELASRPPAAGRTQSSRTGPDPSRPTPKPRRELHGLLEASRSPPGRGRQ